jgi:hypothetical protein
MAKEMIARYPGTCARTGRPIQPGDRILFHGRGQAVLLARSSSPTPVSDHYVIGGQSFYRNKRGRCEDAPCCGCCTI